MVEIIEKQQKEIEQKDKVIIKMADYIAKREVEEVNKQTIRIREFWNKVTPEKPIWE